MLDNGAPSWGPMLYEGALFNFDGLELLQEIVEFLLGILGVGRLDVEELVTLLEGNVALIFELPTNEVSLDIAGCHQPGFLSASFELADFEKSISSGLPAVGSPFQYLIARGHEAIAEARKIITDLGSDSIDRLSDCLGHGNERLQPL